MEEEISPWASEIKDLTAPGGLGYSLSHSFGSSAFRYHCEFLPLSITEMVVDKTVPRLRTWSLQVGGIWFKFSVCLSVFA